MSDDSDFENLGEFNDWLDRLTEDFASGTDSAGKEVVPPPLDEAPDEDESDFYYDDVEMWVQDFLLENVRRYEGNTFHWCRLWWKHAEAICRLDALWKAWEQARVSDDLNAMSMWWRDHFDHHWALLTGQEGPFRLCNSRKHDEVRKLEADWAPSGYWDT